MKEVSAAIIIRNGKIFIAQRPEGKSLAHHWEFPGGKIENGETPEQCLARELWEELNIQAEIGEFFMRSSFDYEFGTINLNAYFVSLDETVVIQSNEHENTCWVSPEELESYNFAPADLPIIAQLKNCKI